LGEIGDASAVPALIAALEDDDPDVIKAATRALVKVGAPALPGLIAALKHRRLRVRRRRTFCIHRSTVKRMAAGAEERSPPPVDG
jgi:HEAT repeat protein